MGQLVSHERWYWAVGAVWWIFVNTTSRGATLVRGFRRVLGTVIGIAIGLVIAVPLDGAGAPTAALVAVCVFGIFYTAAVSYTWMMLAVTVMAGLLYGLLGVLNPGLLALRVMETGVGALGAGLAVLLVLPVTTHATTDAWIQRALHWVHACTSEAAARLAGSPAADPARHVAELELLFGRVRLSLAPLVHPFTPLRARKARARQVIELLDRCAREVRGLASVAADPDASPGATPSEGHAAVAAPHPSGGELALAHLHGTRRPVARPRRGLTATAPGGLRGSCSVTAPTTRCSRPGAWSMRCLPGVCVY